jgi:hypothetical protein
VTLDEIARVAVDVFDDEHPMTVDMRARLVTRIVAALAAHPSRPTEPASDDDHQPDMAWSRDEMPTLTTPRK